jgi:hypothetical protein
VRNWGSEFNAANLGEGTLFDWAADGLDIHQGYGEIKSPYGLMVRIGRQEIAWHGHRLIGTVGWTDQARSFDAARVVYEGETAGAEVLYALLLDRPVADDADTSGRANDAHLLGFRGGPRLGDPLTIDGLAVLRFDRGAQETLATFGGHAKGKAGDFKYEVEGYGQAGQRGGASVLAFLVGVRAGVVIPQAAKLYLGGGFDVVSGDEDPTDDVVRSFDTLYATNHKFYGHIDKYLALPKHAAQQGLIDGMFNMALAPHDSVSVKLDVHVFASPSPADEDRALHGAEIDFNASWKPWKPLKLAVGVWTYMPGAWHGDDLKPELGAYVMSDFNFK